MAEQNDLRRRDGLVKLRAIARGEVPVEDGTALLIVEEIFRWAAARQASALEAVETGGASGEAMGTFEALAMGKLLAQAENVRRGLLGRPSLQDTPPVGPTKLVVTYEEKRSPPIGDTRMATESAALPPADSPTAVIVSSPTSPAAADVDRAVMPPAAPMGNQGEPLDEVDQFIEDIMSGKRGCEVSRQREEAAKAQNKAAELGEQEWRARLIREREDARAHLAAELAEKDRARRARLIEDAEERARRAADLGVL